MRIRRVLIKRAPPAPVAAPAPRSPAAAPAARHVPEAPSRVWSLLLPPDLHRR